MSRDRPSPRGLALVQVSTPLALVQVRTRQNNSSNCTSVDASGRQQLSWQYKQAHAHMSLGRPVDESKNVVTYDGSEVVAVDVRVLRRSHYSGTIMLGKLISNGNK